MVRKLFRTGNSLAVGIPRAAADAVGLQVGDYVEMVGDFLRDYGEALAALDPP